MPNPSLLRILARSFLAGEPTAERIVASASRTLGRQWRWLRPLALRYLNATAGQTRPRHKDVVRFLLKDAGFCARLVEAFSRTVSRAMGG